MNQPISIRNGAWVIIINIDFRIFNSIRTKLFLSLLAIGIIPLLLLMVFIFNRVREDAVTQMRTEMLRQANTISTNLSVMDYYVTTDDDDFLDHIQSITGYRFMVLNRYGDVVYDSNHYEENRIYSSKEVLRILEGQSKQLIVDDETFLTIFTGVVDKDSNEVVGLIMLIGSKDNINRTVERIQNMTYLTILGISLLIFSLNIYFTGLLTKPFSQFLVHLKRVSEGHIDEAIDITGNYEIEEITIAFNDMLTKIEEIDSSRQQFVANVSHELKTPLTSMKVLADSLLAQPDVPIEIYQEFMDDISNEINRETQIINDLLTIVSLDKKDNKLNLEPRSINTLVEQVMRMLKPQAEQRNITLELKSYREVIAEVDETKLYLAFMNLIENGIKYNKDQGKVTVSINADHRDMVIKIADTGIGIPEESVPRVFDRFYRVDKTRSRDTGGTGLGLNIVQKTILMHGGSIKCYSQLDLGTTFTLRIPLTQPVGII